ncbi:hypothetical protein ACSSS7_003207 [Eimeria intestinalis]
MMMLLLMLLKQPGCPCCCSTEEEAKARPDKVHRWQQQQQQQQQQKQHPHQQQQQRLMQRQQGVPYLFRSEELCSSSSIGRSARDRGDTRGRHIDSACSPRKALRVSRQLKAASARVQRGTNVHRENIRYTAQSLRGLKVEILGVLTIKVFKATEQRLRHEVLSSEPHETAAAKLTAAKSARKVAAAAPAVAARPAAATAAANA